MTEKNLKSIKELDVKEMDNMEEVDNMEEMNMKNYENESCKNNENGVALSELTLEEWIDFLGTQPSVPDSLRKAFAHSLDQMCCFKKTIYVLAGYDDQGEGFAMFEGPDEGPILVAYTSKEKFESTPKEFKNGLHIMEYDLWGLIDRVVKLNGEGAGIGGIVFNPGTGAKGDFLVDAELLEMVW